MSYTAKDLNDITADLLLNVVNNVPDVTDVNPGSVMRQLIESIAIEIDALYSQLENVYNGTRIDTATGDDLEQLGKLLGITRKSGTIATGNVTFIRSSVAQSDFSIASGLVVSTQPNIDETQLKYQVSSPVTFYSLIANEAHRYQSGIYDYACDERFIGNSSSVIITGTFSSAPITFTLNTDFGVVAGFSGPIVDVSSIALLDACDATTGWSSSTDAASISLDTSDKRQGTGSLNLGKTGTASVNAFYSKTLSPIVDCSSKDLTIDMKFASSTVINKINRISIYLGNSGGITNSYEFRVARSSLSTGWKRYSFKTSDVLTRINGAPSLSSINYIRVNIETNNASDTITLGDIKMDYILAAPITDYYGDIIRFSASGSKPDNATDFAVTYAPLSKEVACVAQSAGADYNVGKNKIVYQVSNIPSITSVNNYDIMTGGTDTETDSELRERILYATELAGKATAESIRQAILAVNGITFAHVDDLPLRSVTSETHLYSSGVSVYKLDNEVLTINSTTSPTNLVVTGIASGTSRTFIYGTDYQAKTDSYGGYTSELEWLPAGTKPTTNTQFNVAYSFNWLGHAYAFVSGDVTPLPSNVLSNVNTAISESKAAGITVTVYEPTITTVNVTLGVTPDTGYSYTTVAAQVLTALTDFLNNLDIGESVYKAKLYDVVMSVAGVKNANITTPSGDTSISTSQIAKAGTITISQL